jgi:hypothetical protein
MNARRTTFRTTLALMTAAGALGVLPPPAGADPVNAKNGQLLPIVCEKLGSLTVATSGDNGSDNSKNAFTPGHVTTSTQVGIPYEVHTSGSFTPNDGGETQTFSDDFVKKAPHNGRLDVCTFHGEGADENGTFAFDGVVKISYTPR